MRFQPHGRRRRFCTLVLLGGALLLLAGGCPIDSDQLTTDVLKSALESISNSLVEALSTYLAGN